MSKFYTISKLAKLLYANITSPYRVFPNLFILGGTKCGTSSLSKYLEQHPHYVPARKKELFYLQDLPYVNYFTENSLRSYIYYKLLGCFDDGENTYRKFFPLKRNMSKKHRETGGPVFTGDHTPYYLYCSVAAQRIKSICPEAKLIILLRNPIDRLFSHYNMFRAWKQEPRTLEQTIHEELREDFPENKLSYLHHSIYAPHVKCYLDLFNKEQILIIKSEDFFNDPQNTFNTLCRFLNIPLIKLNDASIHNKGKYKNKMDHSTRKNLRTFFKPHNETLYPILGQNFNWD